MVDHDHARNLARASRTGVIGLAAVAIMAREGDGLSF
jgi:hypothetical protein